MFEIIYVKSVFKDLKKIPKNIRQKIKTATEDLQNFPNLTNIKHLKNHPLADYRLKVNDYRILFDVDWKHYQIQILKVGHRRNVY